MSERATEEDTVTHQATVDDKLGDGTWDEEWLAAPRRRSRTRPVLVLALGASLVFLAGVEVQHAIAHEVMFRALAYFRKVYRAAI